MEERRQNSIDHDTLIEIKTEVAGIRADIRDLKSNTSDRLKELEKRVGKLEGWRSWILGGIGVLTFVITTIAIYKK